MWQIALVAVGIWVLVAIASKDTEIRRLKGENEELQGRIAELEDAQTGQLQEPSDDDW